MKSILRNTLKVLGVSALLASSTHAEMMGGRFVVGAGAFGGAFKTDAAALTKARGGLSTYSKDYTAIKTTGTTTDATLLTAAGTINGKASDNNVLESTAYNMSGDNWSIPWGVGLSAGYLFEFGMFSVGPRIAFDFFFTDSAKNTKVYETTGTAKLTGLTGTAAVLGANGLTASAADTGTLAKGVTKNEAGDAIALNVRNAWQLRGYIDIKHCSGFGVFGGVHWAKTTGYYGETELEGANTLSLAFGVGGMSNITDNIAFFFNAGYKIDIAGTEIDFSKSGLNYTESAREIAVGPLALTATASAAGAYTPVADNLISRVVMPVGAGDAVAPEFKADGTLSKGNSKGAAVAKNKIKRNGPFVEGGFCFSV